MIVYTAVVTGPDGAVYTDVRKAEKPAEAEILRVYGNTRYKTGLAITEQLRREQGIEKFETVILTTGENYADALAGSYLAYRRNAPILLIRESTAALVTNYIREHVSDGGLIYVLGGEKAIPEELLAGLDAYEIKRVAGNTRYQTALEILEEAGVERGEEVIVCTGENYADSLSVSSTGKPLFLVKEKLNAAQKSMLAKLAGLGCTFTILGGEKAVTPETEALLRAEVGDALAAERIAGSTRYRTSAMIAERYFPEAKSLILVTGENYPDGLCGGPLGALLGAPVVLTTAGRQSAAAAYAAERAIHSGLVLGGQKAIDDALAREIFGVGENIEISEFFYE